MKIEVTSVSVSKKGTVWMQVKATEILVDAEFPRPGDVYEVEQEKKQEVKNGNE